VAAPVQLLGGILVTRTETAKAVYLGGTKMARLK